MNGLHNGGLLDEHRFDTGEVVLNYAEGPANGSPLVLLHGGGGRWRDLKRIVPPLSAQWHLFAPDLRGHGASGWTPDQYTYDDFARDIEAFLPAVVHTSAILLGHSLGASVALLAAGHNPGQVRALILGDAPKPPYRGEAWQDYIGRLRTFAEQLPSELPPALHTDPTGWRIFRHETERSLGSFNVAALASRVACPVLILQADPACGSQLNDADVAELLRLFPGARHVLMAGRGHNFWRGEDTVHAIMEFLDTVSPRPE